MTTRNLLLTLHIVAVAAWLGANFVQLVLSPWFNKLGGAAARQWTEATIFLGQRYYGPVGALVALTGIGLVLDGPYEFSSGFVGVGIAVVVIGAVMGVAVFSPLAKQRAAALTAGDDATAQSKLNRIVGFALFDTALIVGAALLMVDRWQA